MKILWWTFWLPIGDIEEESWRAPDWPLELHAPRPHGGEEVAHVVSAMKSYHHARLEGTQSNYENSQFGVKSLGAHVIQQNQAFLEKVVTYASSPCKICPLDASF